MFRQILIVCAGNICRSPMAEGLMRRRLAEQGRPLGLASAGLVATPGAPADALALRVAQAHGVDLSAHSARALDDDLIRWAELILVMEQGHRRHLHVLAPTAAGKVFLLGHWGAGDIPDPYLQNEAAFEDAFRLIDEGVSTWLTRL